MDSAIFFNKSLTAKSFRLNVGARTDDVWSRGFSRPKGKNFLKNRDFSSVTGTSASDKCPKISTIDTVRLELCF